MNAQVVGTGDRGQVFIVSGPAGTGKTTLVQMLEQNIACIVRSVTYTTRAPRPREVDGLDYHFLTQQEFQKRQESDEFLESVEFLGNYYGTSKVDIEHQVSRGNHVVLVIDTQGARKLRAEEYDATFIFVSPPSLSALRQRMESGARRRQKRSRNACHVPVKRSSRYPTMTITSSTKTSKWPTKRF